MTDEELAQIEARANAATPGEWHATSRGEVVLNEDRTHIGQIRSQDNAEFIAHAREDIPALIAEVRRLQQQMKRMEESHKAELLEQDEISFAAGKFDASRRTNNAGPHALERPR